MKSMESINISLRLAKRNYDVIAPNLLQGRIMFSYAQEDFAYNYFMNEIGLEKAMKQLKQILFRARTHYKKIYVLGFSIGATLAWLCSPTGLCDMIVGLYGSRIRDHLDTVPKCPTLLLFPAEEKSFDIDDVIAKLRVIRQTRVKKLAGSHGFADPFSKNYNRKSAFRTSKEILFFIKSVSA